MSVSDSLLKYIKLFKRLRVDRTHGPPAPHKPILLISVLQAFQLKLLNSEKVFLTPELVAIFKTNWNNLVTTGHDCRISYPFYYMKSDGFWKLIPRGGFENVDKMGSIMKSLSNLNAAVEYARIENELAALLADEQSNKILIETLLDHYFPDTKEKYYSRDSWSGLFVDIEEKILKEPAAEYKEEIKKLIENNNEEEVFLRGGIFKREIPKIYNFTCCISGMRIDAIHNISMIDACHIIPFSESYDDTISNGIALCPNLHRAFDRGLITISSDYRVIVSKSFNETNSNYNILGFEGKEINLPQEIPYRPSKDNLDWHQKNVFKL